MQSWSYIYVIGAAQGFVLAIALFRKKVNSQSNKILSIWIFLMAFDLAMKSIFLNNPKTPLLPAYTLIHFFPYLYGSLFYLYAKTLTQKYQLGLKDAIHFSGFIIMAGMNILWIINPWENQSVAHFIYEPGLYLYSVSYVIVGLLVIHQYRKNLSQQKSNADGVDLKWLAVMAFSQIIIWMVAITQWLFAIPYYNHWVIYLFISIWILILGYLGLTQEKIEPLVELPQPKTSKKPDKTRFNEVDQRLKLLMHDEQLYLDPLLNIDRLAKKAGYPEYLISLVINHSYDLTFREYINSLRVNQAQILLKDVNNKSTILDIAYECGFVSKSTFNSSFKRITQQTPSAFRQQQVCD